MEITKLWVIVMLVVFQLWSCYGCSEEERIALLQFKASVDHLHPDSLSDWVEGGNCCNWTSVDCNNITGRVTQLQLDGIRRSIDWHMNASLFLPFKEIRSLSLIGNGIAGCVENEGFERLSVLTNLEDLSLDDNYLDDTILSSLSAFSSLKSLSLGSNKIEGPISIEDEEQILKLKNLEWLDLSNNLFDHSILSHLSSLSSLTVLDLSYNQLKGSINVTDLQALRNLESLYLAGNEINQFVASTGNEGLLQLSNLRELGLSNNRFNNSILSSLKELSSLEYLYLNSNQLKGAITLGNWSKLESLYLKGNNITQIEALGNCSKLKSLHLIGNDITQIEGLSNLTNLTSFGLSYNNMKVDQVLQNLSSLEDLYLEDLSLEKNIFEIQGSFPSLKRLFLRGVNATLTNEILGLSNLTNLEILDLSYSNSFLILETIGRMHSLKYLYLRNCGLSGIIPTTTKGLCQLKNLEQLIMNDNNLNGELPSCLTNLTSLQILDISSNNLRGNILSSINEMTSLSYLNLFNNSFYGRIPERMGNMSTLQYLDLSQNYFSGVFPYNFNIPSLQYLSLSENNLEGSFIQVFPKSFHLQTLDLSHNNFTDLIPSSIGLLSDLSFLLLSYNNLNGQIPIELCKLDRLSFIDLSHNNFSGHIQPCIASTMYPRLTTSRRIEATEWMFTHEHPVLTTKNKSYSYPGIILLHMSGIDLSYNNLNGEIPREFGNLSFIKVLNLSHNSLSREIPPTFSNLREIETLDLSFNNLNGSIPPQLTELNFLSFFSVTHNNLSGRTPERVAQFGTFEEVSYRDNPYLCGQPLNKSCSEDISPPSIPENGVGSEAQDELIDMDAFKATFLASYPVTFLTVVVVLYINPQWRRASFHFVGQNISKCYYFMVDNISFLSKLGFS